MPRPRWIVLAICTLVLLVADAARADTRRVPVVVGNNTGSAEHPPLRYAEADAGKLARVLVELGGVSPDDMLLLQGRSLDDVKEAVAIATGRSRLWHDQADTRVVLFFYFSGHSDGKSMELRSDRLDFQTLRSWMAHVGADVRLIIVDSCRSGSLIESKGGRKAEPFEIRLSDDLPKSGEAVVTSSAANEVALESTEIRGSFFTHHLVSGLRGAADASGDGQITLAEAYDYAFVHTRSATADTLIGTQHPSYDYRLSGQGELVLTQLVPRSARLIVPAGYQRVLVTQLLRDQITAEMTTSAVTRLALAPGAYGIRAWRDSKEFTARVVLDESVERALLADELVEARPVSGAGKGSDGDEYGALDAGSGAHRFAVAAAAGRTTGAGRGLASMTAVRLGALSTAPSGPLLNLDIAWGEAAQFSELRGTISFGYRLGRSWSVFSASAGADVTGGIVAQRRAEGDGASSAVVGLSPSFRAAWWIHRLFAFELQGSVLVGVYRRDAAPAVSFWPTGLLGLIAAP